MPSEKQAEALRRDLALADALMAPASEDQLEMLVGTLTEFLPSATNRRLDDDEASFRLALYKEALEDIPADLVDVARKRCIKNCRFSPAPAEIREQIKVEIEEREQARGIISTLLMKYDKNWD